MYNYEIKTSLFRPKVPEAPAKNFAIKAVPRSCLTDKETSTPVRNQRQIYKY